MTERYGVGDIRFFDRFARLYDPLMPAAQVEPLCEAFGKSDRPVRRVLDLAGGTGRVAAALRRADGGEATETLVADASAPMLARARERGLSVVQADASTLPFPNGGETEADERRTDTIDAVVVVDAYHHLPDQ
ncbi:MAG: class I SAM-dependent methyltransferase, partial [Halolamina sp.]